MALVTSGLEGAYPRRFGRRAFGTAGNLKRIRRVVTLNGWQLPLAARRLTGRAHRGRIQRPASSVSWCSDVLEIA